MKISLSRKAINSLIDHAKKGYDKKYKIEVGGHLLGSNSEGIIYVSEAIPYRIKDAGRTFWNPNIVAFERKGKKLSSQKRKFWIGTYHSHTEIAGRASTRQSPEDIDVHLFSLCSLEVIIRVSAGALNRPSDCLSYQDDEYYYDICGYFKNPKNGKIRRIKCLERKMK